MLHFEKINRISKIHENFVETQKFLDNFKTLNLQIQRIQDLIDADGEFQLESPMPKLLAIHFQISQLRDLNDNAQFYASHSTEDVRRTIKKHFAPLDDLVSRFDSILFEISENLLEIVRTGDKSLVVRVAKIIDVEEKQDLAAQIVEEIKQESLSQEKKGDKSGKSKFGNGGKFEDVNSSFRRSIGQRPFGLPNTNNGSDDSVDHEKQTMKTLMGSLKKLHRIRRGYPERFFEAVQKSIHNLFVECRAAFNNDPDLILDNLNWIFTDLGLVKFELVKCMPARWKVFNKFVNFYHVELYRMLDEIIQTEPSAIILLKILQYVKSYYKHMEKVLHISKNDDDDESAGLLVPPLLDGREEKLYDDYLALIVSKLHEWRKNMAATETVNFVERAIPPEVGDDKKLALQGEFIMFSIITQQIDVAAESGQGRILFGTVQECGNILKERQSFWEKTMRQQVELQLSDAPNPEEAKEKDPNYVPVPGGLFEYLMALANDQIRGADYTEVLSNKTSDMVSAKYKTPIIAVWNSVCDGFISLAKSCIRGLINIIFKDLEPAFKSIFAKSSWYKGVPINQVSDTVQEYVSDCREHLNPTIFDVFLDDLLEETIIHYLGSLLNSGVSLKVSKAVDRIKSDIEVLYLLFTKNHEDQAHVQSHFRVFEHFLSALEAKPESLPEIFLGMRMDFWDVPLELFEAMVCSRKDIDTKVARGIVATARTQALHQSQLQREQLLQLQQQQQSDPQSQELLQQLALQQQQQQQPTYLSFFGKNKLW